MKNNVKYDFMKDNYFTELKEQELINSRLAILQQAEAFEGKYFSAEWIRKHDLRFTEDEIAEIDAQMKKEQGEEPPPQQDQEQEQEEYVPEEIYKEEEKPLTAEEKALVESMSNLIEAANTNLREDEL